MIQRCYNEQNKNYHRYGGRGITVYDRWRYSEKNFDIDMGLRPQGLTLDRIDSGGNYGPTNCGWATQKEQVHNSSIMKLDHDKVRHIRDLYNRGIYKRKQLAYVFDVSKSLHDAYIN